MKIFTVIPAYNEAKHISDVIRQIPGEIHKIIVVDDCSKDNTYETVSSLKDKRIELIRHESNTGVGGAMVTGYRYALKEGADIIIKIDGDGQMDPKLIPDIISPIKNGEADYTKGARFLDIETIRQMPTVRLVGNIILSFLTKIVSGYWDIIDPTSGFTAIHREALSRLNLNKINHGFFFESDMLINLYKIKAVVQDIQIPTQYGTEQSHLSLLEVSMTFPFFLISSLVKRILWRYFIADFTAVSLFLFSGSLLFIFGFVFGLYNWIINAVASVPTPTGTVMISVVTLIFGFQLLLQALVLDINNVPKVPLQIKGKALSRNSK
ncbi:MAG: glycosyltransferase family 2 protein [Thermodesulfovibrionia bacterium]|nr:glycosyltransferase family 2 protein [Thermodesulfovibrionia bacterium]